MILVFCKLQEKRLIVKLDALKVNNCSLLNDTLKGCKTTKGSFIYNTYDFSLAVNICTVTTDANCEECSESAVCKKCKESLFLDSN